MFDELCESCDMESMFCELIDLMLEDIKHLESEAVRASVSLPDVVKEIACNAVMAMGIALIMMYTRSKNLVIFNTH